MASDKTNIVTIENTKILFVHSDTRILYLLEEIKHKIPNIDTLYIKINPKSFSFLTNMLMCYLELNFKSLKKMRIYKTKPYALYLNTVRRPAFIRKLSSKVSSHIQKMEVKPDLILQWQGLFSPYISRPSIPFAIIIDNYADPPDSSNQKDTLRGWSTIYNKNFHNLQKDLYENAIMIFTLSKWCKEGLIKEYNVNPKKVIAIGWGAAKGIKTNFSLNKREKTILAVGTDYKAKGLDILLEIAKYLNDFSITIVGKESTYIEKNPIPNNVNVTGHLSDEELEKLFLESEFFFAYSEFEPSAHVLWEAQAYGCIIIGYNAFGIPEAVINNKTGILLTSRKPAVIAEEIKKLYQNKEILDQMKNNAIINYNKNGQWSNVSDKLIDGLKSYLNKPEQFLSK